MASKTPVTATTAKVATPVTAPAAAPVTANVAPATKVDASPAKVATPAAKVAVPFANVSAKPVVAPASVAAVAPKPVAATAPKPAAVAVAPKAVATPPAKAITATVVKPVAKKKAAVKVAPKTVAAKIVETTKPVVAKTKAVVTKEVNIMTDQLKSAADKAKTLFADANAKSTKAFEEINEFSKGNIEALVESGKIAAKGIEALGQDAAEYSRKQFEGATAALKSLSSVKSPTDFFKLQSDYVRSSFDAVVAQTSKNTEAVLKLAGEVAQPISNRVAVAVEKVKVSA